ncbi:MAG: phage holin family protein [Acidimicrobiia bacterium]|nr:phage holin family protein [Acidimicrobiia bacterium]MBV8986802.1 phage holin family protein [Acidimicrobiia bacterium]MBV9042093.1 phage holin family protein [Acidimicrobiia bacterium]MBV9284537.1 phage holin family protein [Acidimicrobiia bacterium]
MADRGGDKSLPTQIGELWRLVLSYLRQETVEPVKNLGRFVAFGVAGSLLLGLGVGLLVLATLRFFQTETGSTFTGHLSWVPYIIMVVVSLVLAGAAMAGWNATRPSSKEDQA